MRTNQKGLFDEDNEETELKFNFMSCQECRKVEEDLFEFGRPGATGQTPCNLCPVSRFGRLTPRNAQYWMYWEELHSAGRDTGLGLGHIRMEAISALLADERAMGIEVPLETRSKITDIEHGMFQYIKDESEKEAETQANKQSRKSKLPMKHRQ